MITTMRSNFVGKWVTLWPSPLLSMQNARDLLIIWNSYDQNGEPDSGTEGAFPCRLDDKLSRKEKYLSWDFAVGNRCL